MEIETRLTKIIEQSKFYSEYWCIDEKAHQALVGKYMSSFIKELNNKVDKGKVQRKDAERILREQLNGHYELICSLKDKARKCIYFIENITRNPEAKDLFTEDSKLAESVLLSTVDKLCELSAEKDAANILMNMLETLTDIKKL